MTGHVTFANCPFGTTDCMSYTEFLSRKKAQADIPGREIPASDVHPMLHDWQNDLVRWAVRTSRAALWADTGMGKTVMQLEWARLSGDRPLIVAPLAVCAQTVREANKLDVTAEYVAEPDPDMFRRAQIIVTNYERLHNFSPDMFDAVVLDESSILKQSDGKTRTMLIDWAAHIPHRLACSATPAPNDPEELTNQAEWLGRMSRTHMLAAYFIHDSDGWRLKGHARQPMIEWMAQWAVALTKPSDVGGDDTGYILPGLEVIPEIVHADIEVEGQLFATDIGGVTGRAELRRKTLQARVDRAAKLVANNPGPWILWCGLNSEAEALAAAVPGSVNVHGSLDPDEKAQLLLGFADGQFEVLVTKPSIASQGLNYQHCHRMAFVGMGDSYEQYYQAIRRCYRYGQTKVVYAHVIVSELESQIAANVARKEQQAGDITRALVEEIRRVRGK
ncbi:DNA helicase [Mycobacterium phage SwagPigglett]|uniref:DNA helicase n=1 Tax=Mycobacterium phage SwagPigglett TaxID=2517970 RepID=A0A482JFF2_9CAUD|nr:DNA helicase [Mycobacterium phage SwagPigglett]QBP30731.1 DNA helicase [Mycobacterium phage SwagPigglett]